MKNLEKTKIEAKGADRNRHFSCCKLRIVYGMAYKTSSR